jgi:poly-gamma-glutamate synthesis protein (capsule biosynthesis protein)
MLHEPQIHVDFDHQFARVRSYLQDADLTIGNLETVFGGFFSDFPLFSAPDDFGFALRNAGFDLLSTANNHALDQGVDGLIRNLDFLEELGIGTFGTHRTPEERGTILIREAGGIKFAFLSYTFGVNSQIPDEFYVNIMRRDLMQNDIARARELADIVIIMPHMGNEYETFVRQEFKDIVMFMLESGADIVAASHPHVVQPMGFVQIDTRRGFIAYSLGNFISSQREIPTETGVILNLYFEKNGAEAALVDFSYVPTWVKFVNANGQKDIQILPIQEENINVRGNDIIRMQNAERELAEIIKGAN